MVYTRREFLKAAGLAAAAGAVCGLVPGCRSAGQTRKAGAAAQKPNIIFILADDLG